MRPASFIILAALACIVPTANAILPNAQPQVARFLPEIDVYPQNFSITVDARQRVYLGNNDGVLIYDGEYWQLVSLPNQDIVRWLEFDGGERVYVGGYDAFGYVEQAPDGRFSYTELSSLFAANLNGEQFGDIWDIATTPEGVYFVGLEHLFRVDPATGATKYWHHAGSFGPIAIFENQVLLQFRGQGIKAYRDGAWTLIESPDLRHVMLNAMVPLGEKKLVFVSSDGPWYAYDGNNWTPIAAADTLPYKASITHASAVNNTTLAITTQLGEVVFLDTASNQAETVRTGNGFLPAVVGDGTGAVFVVDDLGFYALRWPARWQIVGAEQGLMGTVGRIKLKDGYVYALSSSGAFRADARDGHFERLAWTDYEAWDLLPLDDGNMLLADSYQIMLIRPNGRSETIDPNTTARVFYPSPFDPNLVYVGTEFGIQLLRREGSSWRSVFRNDEMDRLRITQLVETSPGELMVGSERGGIRRLSFVGTQMQETAITESLGIEYGDRNEGAYLFEFGGDLVATTTRGAFRWIGERFEATTLGGLTDMATPGRTLNLATNGDESWAFNYNQLFRFDGTWHIEDIAALKRGAIASISIVENQAVIGSLGAVLLFDKAAESSASSTVALSLTSAEIFTIHNEQPNILRVGADRVTMSSADNRLTLRFALPDYYNPGAVRYRTRLIPSETGFSPWSNESQQSFVQLSAGDYLFEVEGRDSMGNIARLAIPIVVTPQWYETLSARATVAVVLLVMLYLLNTAFAKAQSRRLANERNRLEEMVVERTRALQSANQQLDKMAHLDGLTQIPNRRRLDAYLDDVWTQCVERGRVMAVAIIDVDHFKQFNDSYGHQAGDALLIELAKLLSRNLRRAEDLVARYGGEEFLVVLPGAELESALRVIEGMRRGVAASGLNVTVSAGLHVTLPDAGTAVETMVQAADAALYRAKQLGRNQVVVG